MNDAGVNARPPPSPPQSRDSGKALVRLTLTAALVALGLLIMATALSVYALFTNSTTVPSNDFASDTLSAPTGLGATAGASINLSWTATADTYASGHRVLRGTASGGPYTQIAEVTPRTTTTYADSTAAACIRYYYVVRSFYQNWESANSGQANAVVAGVFTNAATSNNTNSWTNPANAQGNPDTVYATAAPAKNATVNGNWAGFGFDSVIPSGASITKVEILAEYNVSTTLSIALLRVNAVVGGAVQGGTIEDASEPTADFDYVSDHTSVRAWTRSDLLDANFKVRVGARRGNSNTAVTFSLDSMRVRATCSAP